YPWDRKATGRLMLKRPRRGPSGPNHGRQRLAPEVVLPQLQAVETLAFPRFLSERARAPAVPCACRRAAGLHVAPSENGRALLMAVFAAAQVGRRKRKWQPVAPVCRSAAARCLRAGRLRAPGINVNLYPAFGSM